MDPSKLASQIAPPGFRPEFTTEGVLPRQPRFHLLGSRDHPNVVQAWLTGLNPELGDRVPVRIIREGDLEVVGPEIIGAARAFAAGG